MTNFKVGDRVYWLQCNKIKVCVVRLIFECMPYARIQLDNLFFTEEPTNKLFKSPEALCESLLREFQEREHA